MGRRGFYVTPYRYDTGTTTTQLESAASQSSVWGLLLLGHGYKKVVGWVTVNVPLPGMPPAGYFSFDPDPEFSSINGSLSWSPDDTNLVAPGTFPLRHKYALVLAYFCYADLQPWPSLVSPNGKYYGGRGSLSVLSGPRGVGYWGSWDGLIGTAAD